jgi:opacity protein-like surface antigen
MSRRRAALILIALLGLAPLTAGDSAAARRRRAFEIYTSLNHTEFDDDTFIDDEVGVGIRFGYLFTPQHELEFLINGVSTEDVDFPAYGIDVSNFQAAYLFNFRKHGVVPYVTAGLGFVHTDDDLIANDETNLVLGLGAGVRFFLGRVLHARFEYRHNQFEGDGPVYADGESIAFRELSFGIGWRFPLP